MSSSFDPFDDEMWDEHQWEAHINEIERKSHQLKKYIESNMDPETPRWIQLLKESEDLDEAVNSYIEEELAFEETYFPDEEDEDWDDEMDDWDDDLFLNSDLDSLDFDDFDDMEDFDDDYEDGEEWKKLSSDFAMSNEGSIENLAIYRHAHDYSVEVLEWVYKLNPKARSIAHNQFVSQSMQMGAKIAAGYSFGFEIEFLGGNIAYNKKALYLANNSLAVLQRIKEAPSTNPEIYYYLHENLFELRNNIGIYVQELRSLFHNSSF